MKTQFIRTHVIWTDSAGPIRYWNPRDEIDHGPTTINTVGLLVKETKKYVSIASSVSTSGCFGGVIDIPKTAIISREDG
jgi:hypothetical protein